MQRPSELSASVFSWTTTKFPSLYAVVELTLRIVKFASFWSKYLKKESRVHEGKVLVDFEGTKRRLIQSWPIACCCSIAELDISWSQCENWWDREEAMFTTRKGGVANGRIRLRGRAAFEAGAEPWGLKISHTFHLSLQQQQQLRLLSPRESIQSLFSTRSSTFHHDADEGDKQPDGSPRVMIFMAIKIRPSTIEDTDGVMSASKMWMNGSTH